VPTQERTREELETMIGVDPIEKLQSMRRDAMERLAEKQTELAKADYVKEEVDAKRKQYRNAIGTEILVTATADRRKELGLFVAPEKVSESALERAACADKRYEGYLGDMETRRVDAALLRIEVAKLELEVQEYTELINRDQALIRYAASEPKT
jgi:RNA 3'-terminal phosphate cyclase